MTLNVHGRLARSAAGLTLALAISGTPAHAQSDILVQHDRGRQVAPPAPQGSQFVPTDRDRPDRPAWLAGPGVSTVVSSGHQTALVPVPTTWALPGRAQFSSITGFGDSYADTGAAPGGGFRMIGWTHCPVGPITQGYPTCRFTGGTNFVDSLQTIYGLAGLTNYAIGGARTDATNTFGGTGAGFRNELDAFATSGKRFTNDELIVLSIGGNDTSLLTSANSIAQVETLATTSAANAASGVLELVASGAHNIAWLSAGNSIYFPAPGSGQGGSPLTFPQRTAWAHTYFEQIQRLLQPAAHSGVRIFLFDLETLQARLHADSGQYGFASADGCQGSLGNVGCFYWNGVHPSSDGMALIAGYMANQMDAPLTVVPQGSMASAIAANFAASVLGRLDAYRAYASVEMGTTTAKVQSSAVSAATGSRWSVYGGANDGSGRDERHFPAAFSDHDDLGGMFGVEHRVDSRWQLGGVFGYSAPDVTLDVQDGRDHVTAYQYAGYGSFTDVHGFADALVAYGHQNHDLERQGLIDVIHARTSADTFTTAGEIGYLVDAGPVRVGPIAGLTYSHAVIEAYTETGDRLITMAVGRQALGNLTGDAGLHMRLPFTLGRRRYSPFVSVTADHDFGRSDRIVTTTQITAPLLPVLTTVAHDGGSYGRVTAGIAATVANRLSASVNVATTFARNGGNDVAVSGGVTVSF